MSAPSFMDFALKAAENAGKSGEVPIGCVIVLNNEVVATAGNRTLTDRDPSAHAEMLAIRQASETVGSERLVDCDLYVTLEPCTMCAGAISYAVFCLKKKKKKAIKRQVKASEYLPESCLTDYSTSISER